jgi:hypothetical protein
MQLSGWSEAQERSVPGVYFVDACVYNLESNPLPHRVDDKLVHVGYTRRL